ncbi:hypothetical protein M2T36_26060, partial [Escherichia coli]|nr:hypothetical protein [Escherichia coli]
SQREHDKEEKAPTARLIAQLAFFMIKDIILELISMIDESVNQSIQDSINELKSQRVDKVIINVPLETEQAQKIAADNDDIVCLFLDVDPYSSVFNVSFNPADGTRASVKYLYEMGHR